MFEQVFIVVLAAVVVEVVDAVVEVVLAVVLLLCLCNAPSTKLCLFLNFIALYFTVQSAHTINNLSKSFGYSLHFLSISLFLMPFRFALIRHSSLTFQSFISPSSLCIQK